MRAPSAAGWLRTFAKARSGVAAVEFALIVPALLVLYMGASQLSVGLTLNRKLQTTASTTADLVGQLSATTSAEIGTILAISRALVEPYDSRQVKISITSVTIDANGIARTDWAKGVNGATTATKGNVYRLPASFAAQRSRSFVVAAVDYTYQPLGGYGLQNGIAMHQSAYLTPRNVNAAIPCPDC